jgi:hypothetical protein
MISKSFKIYSRFKCFSENQSYFNYYLVYYYVFICRNTFSRVSKLQQKGRRIEHFKNLMTTTVPKESQRTNYFQKGGYISFLQRGNQQLIDLAEECHHFRSRTVCIYAHTGLLLPSRHFEKEVKQHAFINLGLLNFFWNFPATERRGRPGPHFALNLIAEVKER